jgi:hypothetical protein
VKRKARFHVAGYVRDLQELCKDMIMAAYHLRIGGIKRSEGLSAVGSPAWLSKETLYDKILSRKLRYAHFKDLADFEILILVNAPKRFKDRATLWSDVKKDKIRKGAQLARAIEITLPFKQDMDKRISLVHEFAQATLVNLGMSADISSIARDSNPHATIMLTRRTITKDGFGLKERACSGRAYILKCRKEWASIQNRKLYEAGFGVRVDHRSYVERGINLEPQVKLGYAAKHIPRNIENNPDLIHTGKRKKGEDLYTIHEAEEEKS